MSDDNIKSLKYQINELVKAYHKLDIKIGKLEKKMKSLWDHEHPLLENKYLNLRKEVAELGTRIGNSFEAINELKERVYPRLTNLELELKASGGEKELGLPKSDNGLNHTQGEPVGKNPLLNSKPPEPLTDEQRMVIDKHMTNELYRQRFEPREKDPDLTSLNYHFEKEFGEREDDVKTFLSGSFEKELISEFRADILYITDERLDHMETMLERIYRVDKKWEDKLK